ncbi:MAG: hypothetical protein ABGW87_06440 [Sphingomonadaceae bacterium]
MRAILGPVAALGAVLALASCGSSPSDTTANGANGSGRDFFPEQPSPKPLGRFSPRNDCISLPGAKPFFLAFEKAVQKRDADALLSLTDPNVKLDFGGSKGIGAFRERLADKQGQLWDELDALTILGCAHAKNGDMVMPWYAAQPMDDIDTANAMIVVGADVPLLQAPNANAPKVATETWDAVTLTDGYHPDAEYLKVKTPSGKEGYMEADMLRSPLDYRLRVSPAAGNQWHIVSFVKGD